MGAAGDAREIPRTNQSRLELNYLSSGFGIQLEDARQLWVPLFPRFSIKPIKDRTRAHGNHFG
jgi:hypothetical protein